jgi:DNA polymerase III psi subunit
MENLISNTQVFGVDIVQAPDTEGLGDKFMGEGRGGHLIVYENSTSSDNNHDFLKKVLQAVKLNISTDCYVLAVAENEKIALGPVLRQKEIKNVLIFGLGPEQVGMHVQLQRYQIATLETQKILLADDLSKIQTDEKLKRALWNGLQDLFLK